MMDAGLEEAGALGTAGAAASVLDGPGEPRGGHGGACLNCGAALAGPFCSACGQKAHVHRSVLHAIEEFVHGVVHFDSRFWNTLPLLIFRPGKLTRDYVLGKRARYIPPVAVFLLTVFSMFLLFAFLPAPGLDLANQALTNTQAATAEAEIRKQGKDVGAEIAKLESTLAANPDDAAAKTRLAALAATQELLKAGATGVKASVASDKAGETAGGASGKAVAGKVAPGDVVVENNLYDVMRRAAVSEDTTFNFEDPSLEKKVRTALANPEFVAYKMKQKGYKLSFLLVPLSLPWLILMFAWKCDVKVYDHVVFLLYSISFMSMIAMIASLLMLGGINSGPAFGFLVMGVPVLHMFAQLKEGYALSWFSASWRTFALATAAVATLAIYIVGIALLGLLD